MFRSAHREQQTKENIVDREENEYMFSKNAKHER